MFTTSADASLARATPTLIVLVGSFLRRVSVTPGTTFSTVFVELVIDRLLTVRAASTAFCELSASESP